MLGANHPSYIWYAADPANNKGSEAAANAAGIKVMGQDLSAACWQANMGRQPAVDPQQTLNTCTEKWQVTEKLQTCELFFTSVRNLKLKRPPPSARRASSPERKNAVVAWAALGA